MASNRFHSEVIIVGGGLAGLSAAIYLGRARRDTLLIDERRSMARWEPDVQNYLGFPDGISGDELLTRARAQARRYHTRYRRDRITGAARGGGEFILRGKAGSYSCRRLLLATGIFHIPPDIPGIKPCLGHSLFFCKDCDGYRIQGKDIGIYGWTNETVEYALGMLLYSSCVAIVTDGRAPRWDSTHTDWLCEYAVPVFREGIAGVERRGSQVVALLFNSGPRLKLSALFTTRGDICHSAIAQELEAEVDDSGEVIVDMDMRTSVPGLYAAGCVTPANCQMIVAAGQGAVAAQAINHDLFLHSLETHSLRRVRGRQLRRERTRPAVEGRRRGAGHSSTAR